MISPYPLNQAQRRDLGLTGFESLSRSEAGGGRLAQGWCPRERPL